MILNESLLLEVSFRRKAHYGSKVASFEYIAAEFFLRNCFVLFCEYQKIEILVWRRNSNFWKLWVFFNAWRCSWGDCFGYVMRQTKHSGRRKYRMEAMVSSCSLFPCLLCRDFKPILHMIIFWKAESGGGGEKHQIPFFWLVLINLVIHLWVSVWGRWPPMLICPIKIQYNIFVVHTEDWDHKIQCFTLGCFKIKIEGYWWMVSKYNGIVWAHESKVFVLPSASQCNSFLIYLYLCKKEFSSLKIILEEEIIGSSTIIRWWCGTR